MEENKELETATLTQRSSISERMGDISGMKIKVKDSWIELTDSEEEQTKLRENKVK